MKKTTLNITGMHCASCATIISKGLLKSEGVKEASVNFSTTKATIEFEENLTNENKLIEIVKSKGYGAYLSEGLNPEEETKKRNLEIKKLKDLFFLSVCLSLPALII